MNRKVLERVTEIKGKYAKLLAGRDKKARREDLFEQRQAELLAAWRNIDVQTSSGPWLAIAVRLDPEYRLAWEEEMLRPLPLPTKRRTAEFVRRIGNPDSTPCFVELARQSLQAGSDTEGARRETQSLADFAFRFISDLEPRRSIHGLADVLEGITRQDRVAFAQREVGRRLLRDPNGRISEAILEMERESAYKEKARCLRDAMAEASKPR